MWLIYSFIWVIRHEYWFSGRHLKFVYNKIYVFNYINKTIFIKNIYFGHTFFIGLCLGIKIERASYIIKILFLQLSSSKLSSLTILSGKEILL